jgi:2-haloacid dehalogenase
MAPVCVFDVNETLLDLAALDGEFERLFGDRGARVAWFGQLLQSAMVATITDRYTAFVARPGKVLDPLARPPDLVVTDLDDLATRLLA